MNKELIDHVWKHCLPKEFKEEAKKVWQTANDEERFPHDAFLRGCCSTMALLFGYHNLTSDAEGEEMLCVSRKEVIRNFKEQVAWKNHHQSSQHDRDIAMGWCNALQFLFGSKCLPDEEKPQPKFHKGDRVKVITDCWKDNIYTILDIKEVYPQFSYKLSCSPNTWFAESTLELAKESKPAEPKFKPGDKVLKKDHNYENEGCPYDIF